jgi:hypothetical protein
LIKEKAMRAITTNWNNAAYAQTATFVDKVSGNAVVIPALNPMNHRSMIDSVESGSYIYQPDSVSTDPGTLAPAPDDEDVVEVTVTLDSVAVAGAPVRASSDDEDVATVSPAIAYTSEAGTVQFTVTSVADGEATITFACGNESDTTVVTVTTP